MQPATQQVPINLQGRDRQAEQGTVTLGRHQGWDI